MADRVFENIGIMAGTYDDTPFANTRSTPLEVAMAEIPFLKTADQTLWVSGPLTLTLTIDNRVGDAALTNVVISDTLDNTKFGFIENSVTALYYPDDDPGSVVELVIGTDYTVAYTAGETTDSLVVTLLPAGAAGTVGVGAMVTISFRGEKVPEP